MLGAGARNHRSLKESSLDAITAIAGIAGPEQYLIGGKLDLLGAGKYSFERRVGKDLRLGTSCDGLRLSSHDILTPKPIIWM
jgi:hypothetical protein